MVAAPGFAEVEALLADLASTRARFGAASWISSYEPGRRLRLETETDSTWIDVETVQTCWETLERLGRIRRSDVLEPGRRSAFMMALFQQIDGIRREMRGELYLVLRPQGRRTT